MSLRTLLLAVAVALLAVACSEEMSLPPLEENPPPFSFDQYFEEGGKLIPKADLILVRRPKHLEHVYALSRGENSQAPGHAEARQLFGILEEQFKGAGFYVANQAFSLRCAAVELPGCIPHWGFIEELMGPGDGPGALSLRQALADSFMKRARELQMENTVVLATVNVLLTRGMLKSALGTAAKAEARAAAVAEQRAMVEGTVRAPDLPPPSPGLVEALTGKNPTSQVAPGPRLPQDVAVSPKPPGPQPTSRPIGPSPTQNAQLQADIAYVRKLGATNIRVNQQQLTHENSQRAGINRPDFQFDYKRRRYHVEYDSPTSGRGPGHQSRITSNDPDAEVIRVIVP